MSASTPPRLLSNSKSSRRANACRPCRDSKSKCSGGIPCTTCQKKRRKPRCYYLNSISQVGESDQIHGISAESSERERYNPGALSDAVRTSEEPITDDGQGVIGPHEDFYGRFSLARSVEEFKQLLPSDGPFQEIIDAIQPVQVFDLESRRAKTASNSLAAQLEQTNNDSISQLSPLLQCLYTKYHSVRALLDSGLATQAWSAFASLIRDSELFGLKEHATLVVTSDDSHDPQPSRQLWWLLIQLDIQLSFLLGRRPCIHPAHGVPKPVTEKMSDEGQHSRENVLEFTQYMIEFLDYFHPGQNDQYKLSHGQEDKGARLQLDLGRLQQLESRLPRVPNSGLEEATLSAIAQHQIDVQFGLMIFYCQMLRSTVRRNEILRRLRSQRKSTAKVYYKELLKSLRKIIDLFDHSYRLDPTTAASSWPRCFGVFSAVAMLGIARLQQHVEVDLENDRERIETALKIFSGFAKTAQASGIAQLATESFAEILEGITELKQQPSGSTGDFAAPPMPNEGTTSSDGVSQLPGTRASRPAPKVRTDGPTLKRSHKSNPQEDTRAKKRVKREEEPTIHERSEGTPAWRSEQHHQYSQAMSFGSIPDAGPQEPPTSQAFEQQPYPQTAAASFNDQMDLYEAGYLSAHPSDFNVYHPASHWVHPPMTYLPPLMDNWWQVQFQSNEDVTMNVGSQQMFHHYHPPMALPMDQALTREDVLHGGQHPGFFHMQQSSPTHAQDMMMTNAQDMHSMGSTSAMAHSSRMPPQAQVYSSQTAHARLDQTMSSPGEATGHLEGAFARPSGPDRQHSLADIRQQQLDTWANETPHSYKQKIIRTEERGDGQERRQSPPQPENPSPASDQDFPPPGDAWAMQQRQSQQQNTSLSASRGKSRPRPNELGMPTIPPDQYLQPQWHEAQRAAQPSHYDMRAAQTPYALMSNEDMMEFDHQLQYHPHVAVTTGPFTGGQDHRWG